MSVPYVDAEWDAARRTFSLPDTCLARTAFFLGGRNALDCIVNALPANAPADITSEVDALREMFVTRLDEEMAR